MFVFPRGGIARGSQFWKEPTPSEPLYPLPGAPCCLVSSRFARCPVVSADSCPVGMHGVWKCPLFSGAQCIQWCLVLPAALCCLMPSRDDRCPMVLNDALWYPIVPADYCPWESSGGLVVPVTQWCLSPAVARWSPLMPTAHWCLEVPIVPAGVHCLPLPLPLVPFSVQCQQMPMTTGT